MVEEFYGSDSNPKFFRFLDFVELSTTTSVECAMYSWEWVVCFYVFPFKFRLCLLVPRFVLSYFDFAPGHLMPNC